MGNQTAIAIVEIPEPKAETPPATVYCEHCEAEVVEPHECFPIEPMSCW